MPAVEAAAAGAPVVLSDIPYRETLGGAALFFPPGDVQALATELERLSRDEGLRRRAGSAARERVAGLS